MKEEIVAILKAYIISFVVLSCLIIILALILINNPSTVRFGKIILSCMVGITFFVLGFLFGNHYQKQGLIRGLLAGAITMVLVLTIYLLNNESINYIQTGINIVVAGIGGIIGVSVKKLL